MIAMATSVLVLALWTWTRAGWATAVGVVIAGVVGEVVYSLTLTQAVASYQDVRDRAENEGIDWRSVDDPLLWRK